MQQLQKMQSQPAQSMLKSTPLRMSMPHVNQSVLLNKNYPWTTISNSWNPLPCLLTFKKVQSQPGRSMLKSTPLRIGMFHVNQGVLVINFQCLLCNFPIVIKLIMFQIIISVIQPPFKNYLTIQRVLLLDKNYHLTTIYRIIKIKQTISNYCNPLPCLLTFKQLVLKLNCYNFWHYAFFFSFIYYSQ